MDTMTPDVSDPRVGESDPARLDAAGDRRSVTPWLLAVLAIGLCAALAWIVYDRADGDAPPTEVEQVIDEYLRAWNEHDEVALRAVTAADFEVNEFYYERGTSEIALEIDEGVHGIVTSAFQTDYRIERGQMVVSGDGPWIVAFPETWHECLFKDGDTCRRETSYVGSAMYVVVGDLDSPEIAVHYWTGLTGQVSDE